MEFVLGIDKGTSVVKAVVFDEAGAARGQAQRRVGVLSPRPGWHEEDPDQTWDLTAAVIREAIAGAGIEAKDIKGVGISGHMGGAWLIDGEGRPTRNAICWPDERAQPEQMEIERAGKMREIFAISGNGLMPGITAMLLGWLSKHEPQTVAGTRHVLCAKDYLRFRLTGDIGTDPSDVSFVPGDIDARGFSNHVLDLCGASAWIEKLPSIQPSEAIAGTVTRMAAEQTGLAEGTPVVTGLGDACANALGVGALSPGAALTVLGTSCLNSLVTAGPDRAPEGLGFLFSMPGGHYVRILPNTSGTIAFDWFLDRFGAPLTADGKPDFTALAAQAASAPIGSQGVIFIPYVNGSGVLAPFHDAQARGGFFGTGSHTTYDHLLRSVYEGLCFATRDCFDAMTTRPRTLTLTGGGARSPFWAQLFADVLGLPIETVSAEESGAFGVAMLAGVATGVWKDLDEAAGCNRVTARYEPDAQRSADYDDWFGLYQDARDVYRRYSARRAALKTGLEVVV
ncbi:FGGY-family carbohydrate kinase [Rhizobium sp. G21]|uniref:FGGY-family carbohydrate kinase n=1 Tax=Rhizobium sp. G21 TaxID=2758439 RepID=UPI0016048F71|nr:FGGY-family carbohydrate kinase [Rhizobium sp. G21]MBB1251025.1 carbohydrate kinase [Rhizobium sp. G21]